MRDGLLDVLSTGESRSKRIYGTNAREIRAREIAIVPKARSQTKVLREVRNNE
jgi:hypothetical protein